VSAIFGRVDLSGRPVDGAQFLSCFDKLKPYGPDLSETWIEGPTALGRHLLRVAPAASQERLAGLVDGVIVVADAILDNRDELASALGLSPAQLNAASDTDLIRESFLRWGEDCVHRLIGDYAFAAIRPHSREIFLARDHIGSRPLFWALRDQTLIFSSAIEGIVGFGEWKWSIDQRVIAEYLLCPLFPVSKPFFRDIRAVPAGSSVVLRRSHVSVNRWWRPSLRPVRHYKSQADVAASCRALLERAVADRVDTEGRIGAHFSGGIDSTGVAVIGSRALRARSRSLTRGYAWSPPISD
jgi:asparagine synthase (glutamine-hydrolysing)